MKHGTQWGYRSGCRCDLCRSARTEAGRAYRQRKRSESGSMEREINKRTAEELIRIAGIFIAKAGALSGETHRICKVCHARKTIREFPRCRGGSRFGTCLVCYSAIRSDARRKVAQP